MPTKKPGLEEVVTEFFSNFVLKGAQQVHKVIVEGIFDKVDAMLDAVARKISALVLLFIGLIFLLIGLVHCINMFFVDMPFAGYMIVGVFVVIVSAIINMTRK